MRAKQLASWHARVRPKTMRMSLLHYALLWALLFVAGAWVLFAYGRDRGEDLLGAWCSVDAWALIVFALLWAPERTVWRPPWGRGSRPRRS